jgi:two-component system, LytTR family, sensor kinase
VSETRVHTSRRILPQLGIAFVAWSIIAVAAYIRVPLRALALHEAPPPLSGVLGPLVACWIWALFTPPILWLVEKYPLDRRTWLRHGLVHLVAAAATVVVGAPPTYAILTVLHVPGHASDLTAQILSESFIDLFSYAALVALGHALAYYRLSTEQRLRASTLEARLLGARMEALEARMHPHFLFNALNTVSSLVRTGDCRAAVRAVARIGDLLRNLLLDEGQEILLSQELDFVGRYLELEQARFGERLSATIEADPAVTGAFVPRLVLQPLVENALRHGIEPFPDAGRIEVRASRAGEMLSLEVRDTGAGGGSARPSTHTGLANTRARLEQLYGEKHELALSTDAQGTVARVVIPFCSEPRLQR